MAEEEGHHHHSLRKNEEDQKNNLLIYSTDGHSPPPICRRAQDQPSFSRALVPIERPSITKLVVRPGAHQTNPRVIQEGDEAIDEDPAKCKSCSRILSEANIVVKVKCNCINALALAHEACVGGNCAACRQKIQKIQNVTLLRVTVAVGSKKSKNRCW